MSAPVVDPAHLRRIAQSRSDAAKTNALLNAAKEIERLRESRAELIEANRALTKAVRGFADGEMSGELRTRLFRAGVEEPARETFYEMCAANDTAEAAISRVGGGK